MDRNNRLARLYGAHAAPQLNLGPVRFCCKGDDLASEKNTETGGADQHFAIAQCLHPHVVARAVEAVVRDGAGKRGVGHLTVT